MTRKQFQSALRKWRGAGADGIGHISQAQAARRLGISPRTLQSWEIGNRMPRGIALAAVLAAIDERAGSALKSGKK